MPGEKNCKDNKSIDGLGENIPLLKTSNNPMPGSKGINWETSKRKNNENRALGEINVPSLDK